MTMCVYRTECLGTRLAPPLIQIHKVASIYSQPHILRFPCHMRVKRISTGEVMMLTDLVTSGQISTVVEKAFHIFQ